MTEINLDFFKKWNKAIRVRKLEKAFEELAVEAEKQSISVDELKKRKGFKSDTDFFLSDSCPQFDVFCWPSELAELGAGYVLYFHFLAFVAGVLFISFLVQVPALMAYYDQDNIELWAAESDNEDHLKSNATLGKNYGTPGNYGPEGSDNDRIPMYYTAMVIILGLAVIAKSAFQIVVNDAVDAGTTHPNDFAVLVEGLPTTATDEQAISDWFKENAVRGQNDTEIVKVVIGWSNKEFQEKTKRIIELRKLIADNPLADEVKDYKQEMMEINKVLMSTAPDTAAKFTSSGVAVVIFRSQADHRRCLDRWTHLWAQYAYRDSGGLSGILGGGPLPKYPIGDPPRPVYRIKVSRAPNPGDINWVDLGVDRETRLKKAAECNGILFAVICVSFGIVYLMNWIKEQVDNAWLGLLPAFGIAFANVLVQQTAKKMGMREYHNTLSSQTSSQALKMTIGMLVNTAGIIFAVSPKASQWFSKTGLVHDVIMLIGLTAVIQPLFMYFDLKFWITQKMMGGKLNDAKMAEWNQIQKELAAAGGPAKASPDLVGKFKQMKSEIAFFKKIWEPSEMDMIRRYAYAVRTFVCCMYYAPLVPIITFVGIIGITVQYWVDKKVLTCKAKRPSYPVGATQAKQSLLFMRVSTLLMPLAMWVFLHPCWEKQGSILMWMGLSYAVAVFICFVPLDILRKIFCAPCKNQYRAKVADVSDSEDYDYYSAQRMWPTEMKYHKSHFLYKCLPESKNPEFFTRGASTAMKDGDLRESYDPTKASEAAGGKDDSGVHLKGHKVHGALGTDASDDPTPTYGAIAGDPGAAAGAAGAAGGGTTYGAAYGAPAAGAPAAGAPAAYGAPAVGAPAAGAPAAYGAPAATPAAAASAPAPAAAPSTPAGAPTVVAVVTPAMAPIGGGDAAWDPPGVPAGATPVTVVTPVADPAAGGGASSGPTWEYCSHGNWRKYHDDCHDYIEKQYQDYLKRGDSQKRARIKTQGVTLSVDFEKMSQMVEGKHGLKDIRRTP